MDLRIQSMDCVKSNQLLKLQVFPAYDIHLVKRKDNVQNMLTLTCTNEYELS